MFSHGVSGSTRSGSSNVLAAAQHDPDRDGSASALPILHTCHPLRGLTPLACHAYSWPIPIPGKRINLRRR